MGQVLYKINCPGGTHVDNTPSCAVYVDGSGFCFSCSTPFKNLETAIVEAKPVEPENLTQKMIEIQALPSMVHRGLTFHYDNRGYYVVWPGGEFYKHRLWAPGPTDPKYKGPRGLQPPWFVLRAYHKVNTCILTEGEINALSISQIREKYPSEISQMDIGSPGSATKFYDSEMKRRVEVFKNYAILKVLLDEDDAGVKAAVEFHKLAKPYISDIRIKLMPKGQDANDILVSENGPEKLKRLIMEM